MIIFDHTTKQEMGLGWGTRGGGEGGEKTRSAKGIMTNFRDEISSIFVSQFLQSTVAWIQLKSA